MRDIVRPGPGLCLDDRYATCDPPVHHVCIGRIIGLVHEYRQ